MSDPLTGHGEVLGTLQYMFPEALEGRTADARSDIFSFGAVLYEMVTGRRAFGGNSPASVIGAILKDDAPSILGADPSASVPLGRIIRTCLSKDPDERWQSAHDVRLELQWAAEMLERARDRPRSRVSRLGWWVAATVAASRAAVTALLADTTSQSEPRKSPATSSRSAAAAA